MGLRLALVDRAYLLRKAEADPAETVEGTVIFADPDADAPPPGRAFRCRLELGSTPERTRDGMTQTDPRPTLICAARFADGTPVELRSSDQLKVVSRALGSAVWEIDADPEALRERRRLIGWRATIHRTREG